MFAHGALVILGGHCLWQPSGLAVRLHACTHASGGWLAPFGRHVRSLSKWGTRTARVGPIPAFYFSVRVLYSYKD